MEPLNEAILFSVFTRRIKKIRGIHNEIRSLLSLWLATVCISHARRYSYAIFKRCAIRITYSGGEKVGFKGARARAKDLKRCPMRWKKQILKGTGCGQFCSEHIGYARRIDFSRRGGQRKAEGGRRIVSCWDKL